MSKVRGIIEAVKSPVVSKEGISDKGRAWKLWSAGLKVNGTWCNASGFNKEDVEKVLAGVEKGNGVEVVLSEEEYPKIRSIVLTSKEIDVNAFDNSPGISVNQELIVRQCCLKAAVEYAKIFSTGETPMSDVSVLNVAKNFRRGLADGGWL